MNDIDTSAIAVTDRHEIHDCRQCGAVPGAMHVEGCGVERCGCGYQAIGCDCSEEDYRAQRPNNRWTGVWPGVLDAEALGYFCRDFHPDGSPVTKDNPLTHERAMARGIRYHVPCTIDDPGAHADLNRYYRERAMGTLPKHKEQT